MKKCALILMALLFFVAQPTNGSAGMKSSSAERSTQNDQIPDTGCRKDSRNFSKSGHSSGTPADRKVRVCSSTKKRLKGSRYSGKPVPSRNMTPLKGCVALVQGEARMQLRGKGDWISLKAGDHIPPRSNLRTGRDGAVEIKYEDGSSLLLRSHTEVTIIEAWKTRTSRLLRDFFLSAGRVTAKVQSVMGRSSRFRIHTPTAIASVRGTEFRVTVDKEHETCVEVLKSRVTVDTATKVINLAQGEGARIKNPARPLPPRKLLLAPNPVGLESLYNTAPVISLASVGGAQAYRVMVAKDEQGKQLVWEREVRRGERVTMSGLDDGSYFLLTQSIDPIGLEGVPSEAFPFTIRENPLPPMLLTSGCERRAGEKAVTLEWLSVADAARYHLQISEDGDFRNPVVDRPDLAAVSFRAEGLENKPYSFRIRSVARDDSPGGWSDPVAIPAPCPPQASSGAWPDFSDGMITLRSRSAGEGFKYHVQIARDDRFQEILVDEKVDGPEISVRKPKESGTYFVRIASVDGSGKTGSFSRPQSFAIQNRFPPEWIGIGSGTGLFLLLLLFTL